jgi:hypothetical protein
VTLARALVLIALGLAEARAASLAVIVRVGAEGDEALYQRVRGQTSDLDVALDVERGALEVGLAAQVEAARDLASARGARVVVWFETKGEEVVVVVAEPASGRVLARRLDGAETRRERSARLEAAAQVVRSSLRALAAGGVIGVAAAEAVAEAEGELPPPPPVTRPAAVPETAVARPGRAVDWRASVGWQVGADGASDGGAHALAARVAVERGPLALDLVASAGVASRLDDERSTVELARHGAGVAVAWGWRFGETRLAAGVSAGVAAWRRSTVIDDPTLMATPSRTTFSFVAAPELRGAWVFAGGAVGIEATLGADLVAPAPRLVVRTAEGLEIRNDLWPLQPRVGLAVVVRTGD